MLKLAAKVVTMCRLYVALGEKTPGCPPCLSHTLAMMAYVYV